MKVLGRTLEHLGVQMYKRRDVAIAELVANCWDANAKHVWIELPTDTGYSQGRSVIRVEDDGEGMDQEEVGEHYLVVGRNRRADDADRERRVMGRKGIGKLAGFGIAKVMTVETWRDGVCTKFALDIEKLKTGAGEVENVGLEAQIGAPPDDVKHPESGTRLTLSGLKHTTPLAAEKLTNSLARRFSHKTRGLLELQVNDESVGDPYIDWDEKPEPQRDELKNGKYVEYVAGFSKSVLGGDMRGFTVMVAGKTAQAPPFYFDVEATASGQLGTRYLHGWIDADFLDDGVDDESDIISTDRQEIDWDAPDAVVLKEWGAELTRRLLREWAGRRKKKTKIAVYDDPVLKARIERLDPVSKNQVDDFLGKLGQAELDDERTLDLARALVRVYEYRHFHDVTDEIKAASDDPDQLAQLLSHLADWKVLESRAILEIVSGRLQIVDKFREMVVSDAPETAPRVGAENIHDLLARYPWLINPEWQVMEEEKQTTKYLRDRGFAAEDPTADRRFDFLALEASGEFVVLEIKRPGYAVTLDERQRVEKYVNDLSTAHKKIRGVIISGGEYNFNPAVQVSSIELLKWSDVYTTTRRYYEHYRNVVQGEVDSGSFASKQSEVLNTRQVLDVGVYRSREERSEGVGDNDFAFDEE